jgi:hypothetical protein
LERDLAGNEIAATARVTIATVPSMPADTDALTRCPPRNAGAYRIYGSGNLVSWDSRVLKARPRALLCKRIAVTDATSINFDADLSRAWLGDFPLNNF